MNEQAWKEQAARVLAASDGLNYDEVCGVDADPDNGYCDSGTCVAAFYGIMTLIMHGLCMINMPLPSTHSSNKP